MNKLYAIACLCLLFCSCSPRIYFPDRTNVPFLSEAGETKLTASAKIQNQSASSKVAFSPSLDFAVALTDNIGIMASFRNTNRYANDDDWLYSNSNSQDSIHYSGNRFELGAGYFMPFGTKGHFEVYGGFGSGNINRDNLRDLGGNYTSKYYRIFIQPAVGMKVKDIIEFGGGMRFAYQRFNAFSSDDPDLQYDFTHSRAEIENTGFFFWEPFVHFAAGPKYVKFNLQAGFGLDMTTTQLYNNSPFYLSLGITFDLAPRFWKENKKASE